MEILTLDGETGMRSMEATDESKVKRPVSILPNVLLAKYSGLNLHVMLGAVIFNIMTVPWRCVFNMMSIICHHNRAGA